MKASKSDNTHAEVAVVGSPLGDYPEQFQRHLESQRYKPTTITQYGHCIDALRGCLKTSLCKIKHL